MNVDKIKEVHKMTYNQACVKAQELANRKGKSFDVVKRIGEEDYYAVAAESKDNDSNWILYAIADPDKESMLMMRSPD